MTECVADFDVIVEADMQRLQADIELTNKIVALDLAEGPNNYGAYALFEDCQNWMSPHDFVRHWDVVGMVMEECLQRCEEWGEIEPDCWTFINRAPSLPRAIIEACVSALTTGDQDP